MQSQSSVVVGVGRICEKPVQQSGRCIVSNQNRRMASVRVVRIDRVSPPRRPDPLPGDTIIPLSFLDAYWIGLPPIQRVFLYPNAPTFSSLLQTLKSSLSETLLLYHPLAGKLTYLPSSGDAVVDCSAAAVGDGVAVVEAESDGDIVRLAGEETHDLQSFLQLVPELEIRELPAPVLAVQVTRFVSGGVALGFSAHHAVVDGRAVWSFLETWAEACKLGGPPGFPMPSHDRAVIRHPRSREIARHYLRQLAPALPKTAVPSLPIQARLHLAVKTFKIDASTIRYLKESARQRDDAAPPSTLVAVSAHAWISFALAKGIEDDEGSILAFAVDCRTRLNPPLKEGFTGNCVRIGYARATGYELRGEEGPVRACAAIGRAMRECLEDPLSGCEDWVGKYLSYVSSKMMYIGGSPRFRAYEIDFGWGRPSRVELVSMNYDGEVVLLGGREEGEVQASIALSSLQMDAFSSVFVGSSPPVKNAL